MEIKINKKFIFVLTILSLTFIIKIDARTITISNPSGYGINQVYLQSTNTGGSTTVIPLLSTGSILNSPGTVTSNDFTLPSNSSSIKIIPAIKWRANDDNSWVYYTG